MTVQACEACKAAQPFNRHGSRTCGRVKDWEVSEVQFSGYGFHVNGWNHASGQPFAWGFYTSQIPEMIREPRYDWGALTGLASPVRNA